MPIKDNIVEFEVIASKIKWNIRTLQKIHENAIKINFIVVEKILKFVHSLCNSMHL